MGVRKSVVIHGVKYASLDGLKTESSRTCVPRAIALRYSSAWRSLALAVFYLVLSYAPVSYATDGAEDEVELRLDVGFKLKLPADLRLRFTQNIRFDDRIQRFYQLAPELEFGYAPFSWLYWGIGYRYQFDLDDAEVFQHRHRPYTRLLFPLKIDIVRLIWRAQWQADLRTPEDAAPRGVHMVRFRMRAKVYVLPYLVPHVSVESFQRLDASDDAGPLGSIRKLRFQFGVEWNIATVTLNTAYFVEVPTVDRNARLKHAVIVGASYNWAP